MPIDRVIRLDPSDPPGEEIDARPWRVLIVDDYPLMRRVVRLVCETSSNLEVVGETGNGVDALEMCASLSPDIIVLDADIDVLSGVEVARELRATGSPIRILMLTGSDAANVAFECMRLNVDGFIDKTTAMETLAGVIEQVASGTRVVSATAGQRALQQFGVFLKQQREVSHAQIALTARETSVLEMIARGWTTTRMARRLGLSERTIECHIGKAYKKLGVRTRTAALRKASALGVITNEDAVIDA